MTPFSDVNTPPGGYKRAEDHVSQLRRIYIRTPILFYTLVAILIWMFVLTVGSAILINRQADQTARIRAGTCVIVTTLEVGAADAESRLKSSSGLTPDRVTQLKQSLAFQRRISHDIRERVECPSSRVPAADPDKVPTDATP